MKKKLNEWGIAGIILIILALIFFLFWEDEEDTYYGKIDDIRFPESNGKLKIGTTNNMLVNVRSNYDTTLFSDILVKENSNCISWENRKKYIYPHTKGYLVPKIIVANDTSCIGKEISFDVLWKDINLRQSYFDIMGVKINIIE